MLFNSLKGQIIDKNLITVFSKDVFRCLSSVWFCCISLPGWVIVLFKNTFYFSHHFFYISLSYQFHALDKFFRDKYIYIRELLWPSCWNINRKQSYLSWSGIGREILSRVQLKLCMWVSVWMRVLAMYVLLRVVSAKLHGFRSFVRWRNRYLWSSKGKVGLFCLWRVRREEQISVPYHLSITFSQQYSFPYETSKWKMFV